jgi:hypothetical protein
MLYIYFFMLHFLFAYAAYRINYIVMPHHYSSQAVKNNIQHWTKYMSSFSRRITDYEINYRAPVSAKLSSYSILLLYTQEKRETYTKEYIRVSDKGTNQHQEESHTSFEKKINFPYA